MRAQLLPAQQISSRHRSDNSEAYAEYLLGNQFRDRDTVEANKQALAAYRKAVALDPGYAAAYSGIADAEWRIADQTGETAGYGGAAVAADKAIALAPESPEGYWARGRLRNYYYFDWHGAEADFQKALALDANFVPAQVDYADLLATLGRTPDALAMLRRTIAADPLSVPAWRALAALLMGDGQFAEARVAAHRMVEVSPGGDSRHTAAFIDLFDGRPQQALAGFQSSDDFYSLIFTAMADYTLGRDTESQRAFDELIKKGAMSLAYQIAEVYAWRGERDKAWRSGSTVRTGSTTADSAILSMIERWRACAMIRAITHCCARSTSRKNDGGVWPELLHANPSSGFAPHSSCPTTFRRRTVFSAPLDARQLHLPGGELPVVEEQHGAGAVIIFVDECQMLRALVGAVGGVKVRQDRAADDREHTLQLAEHRVLRRPLQSRGIAPRKLDRVGTDELHRRAAQDLHRACEQPAGVAMTDLDAPLGVDGPPVAGPEGADDAPCGRLKQESVLQAALPLSAAIMARCAFCRYRGSTLC